ALRGGEERGHIGVAAEERLQGRLVAAEEQLLAEEALWIEPALPEPGHRQEVAGERGAVHPGGGGSPQGLQLEARGCAHQERRATADRASPDRTGEHPGTEPPGASSGPVRR